MTQRTTPAEHLVNATERLYRAFAGTFRAAKMHGCPHCVTGEMTRDLCSIPLRELTPEDIGTYAFKAITTWGDEADYQYFFPRILELCNGGYSGEPGLATYVMRGKLELANWGAWPAAQLEAIEHYLDAIFQHALPLGPRERSATFAVEELSQLKLDVTPWLVAWGRANTPAAHHQLAEAVIRLWSQIASTGLAFKCSHDAPESVLTNARVFANWLRAPEQCARLEQAFEEQADSGLGSELAEAIDAYQWL